MICERCGKRETVNLRENFCYPCQIAIHLEETIKKQECGYASRCRRCGEVVAKHINEPYCSECFEVATSEIEVQEV